MYKVSIPVMLTERFDREKILNMLRQAGAHRVFLAVDIISNDETRQEQMLQQLRQCVPFFKENGFETGIWFWALWRSDIGKAGEGSLLQTWKGVESREATSLNSSEKIESGNFCPSSPEFRAKTCEIIRRIAETGPDILMFDDDFRYGFRDGTIMCYCDRHMEIMQRKLGRRLSREELRNEIYAGKPNEARRVFHESMGESLLQMAKECREAVDSVNPRIRFALCAVMCSWDTDGIDAVAVAKALAGSTKPLMRFIGAPYWAKHQSWGNRLQHIVELERMEYSWCEDEEIETMTEGDVFPRPRYKVPASFLEIFDTALRSAGVADGILKYMSDYVSSAAYEMGYIRLHQKHAGVYAGIDTFFGDKTSTGVRVYEHMHKFAEADVTGIKEPESYCENMFFSRAARLLTDNTIPTMYRGNEGVGIAFGENARHLPQEAFENSLILDIRAAGILMEQGVDVGIEAIGQKIAPDLIWYPEENEHVRSMYGPDSAYAVTPRETAQVIAWSVSGSQKWPDVIRYTNAAGQKFLVFAFDAAMTEEDRYRAYSMQRQLYASIAWLGGSLAARCAGSPDLYIQTKRGKDGSLAVGLWNISADPVLEPVVELDRAYQEVKFLCGTGSVASDTVKLADIPAYSFVMFEVK